MTLARTAAGYGATIATRVECINLLREDGVVVGAEVRDVESGRIFEVQAAVTALAAGVWSDEIHHAAGIQPGFSVTMSKGVHITVPGSAIELETGVIIKTDVSVLFIIPWKNEWLIGTTDTPWTGERDNPLATSEDVAYILEHANQVLVRQIQESDILAVFTGLRPLVDTKRGSATTKISREHIVDHPMRGLVSVAGGKYTTYRIMARDLVDAAVSDLDRKVPESCTEDVVLVGGDGVTALRNRTALLAKEYGITQNLVAHLIGRYGALFPEVLALAQGDPMLLEPVIPELAYLRAEIRYAVLCEGARTLEDVFARRTRISFETADGGIGVARQVALMIADVLGWDAEQINNEVARYEDLISRERKAAFKPSGEVRSVS